ncbi:DUF3788 domain-containing protein [uncultured Tissierella sp.]|uniref:DUF3788 domain-containing protein n=1 Tax=uncultured Tissierella sp. TaxID=448160 RepID=UPI002803DA32|nr:DUF3788 domain-containing protein [uncultured Tissierella sp.]MDU5080466.1 DUF3788 domain-containing protein [Bacillota bacterium]
MKWSALYGPNNQPSLDEINRYVNTQLWQRLNLFLQSIYHINPKLYYSQCSMQPGWNVKYRKYGKSLCTLYPMSGFYIALIVISNKESLETQLMLPSYAKYTQNLYQNTTSSHGSRWLMIKVTEPKVLDDVISLIQIRVKST